MSLDMANHKTVIHTCQDGNNLEGGVTRTSPVLKKKRLTIEATDPEVVLPAGYVGEGWVAVDGKRLVASNRCVPFFVFAKVAYFCFARTRLVRCTSKTLERSKRSAPWMQR